MSKLVEISLEFELPGKKAKLYIAKSCYEIVDRDPDKHCPGYGYFKTIGGLQKLIALYVDEGQLFFYFDGPVNLSSGSYRSELKQGLLGDNFSLYRENELVASVEYTGESNGADVMENLHSLLSDSELISARINETIEFLSISTIDGRERFNELCRENAK